MVNEAEEAFTVFAGPLCGYPHCDGRMYEVEGMAEPKPGWNFYPWCCDTCNRIFWRGPDNEFETYGYAKRS